MLVNNKIRTSKCILWRICTLKALITKLAARHQVSQNHYMLVGPIINHVEIWTFFFILTQPVIKRPENRFKLGTIIIIQ